MLFKTIVILFYFLLLNINGQERDLKIVKILDANLFQTEDSLQVQMADMRVPSIHSGDSTQIEMAKKAIEFANIHLLNLTSRFVASPKNKCSEDGIISGHLFRKYPLEDTNINAKYLEQGFAVYLPCDTLFMEEYRTASEKAMDRRKGFWAASPIARPPDYFNRFRASFLIVPDIFVADSFLPIIGLNYRWSDLYSVLGSSAVQLNLSAEAGTFFYIYFPYGNLGAEFRFAPFYLRAHYNVLLPFPGGSYTLENGFGLTNFYGFDAGIMMPISKRTGIEFEVSSKMSGSFNIVLFTISLVSY
jgi:endonuclease YncB( thermonuclease family)